MSTPLPTTDHEQTRKGESLGARPLPSTQSVSPGSSMACTSGHTKKASLGAGSEALRKGGIEVKSRFPPGQVPGRTVKEQVVQSAGLTLAP
eukprot:4721744-Amphidinium_carterae.1